mgnify:CR=1 FL=1
MLLPILANRSSRSPSHSEYNLQLAKGFLQFHEYEIIVILIVPVGDIHVVAFNKTAGAGVADVLEAKSVEVGSFVFAPSGCVYFCTDVLCDAEAVDALRAAMRSETGERQTSQRQTPDRPTEP